MLEMIKVLSTVEILNLFATPLTLIPAVAGKTIRPISLYWNYFYNTVDFANGGFIQFTYSDLMSSICNPILATVLTAGASNKVGQRPISSTTHTMPSIESDPIVISNATAPFINGDGSLAIRILYYIS